ncbi:MAG: hypothetical protein ACI8PZ_002186 [Myxococcota bacterium]|jgi:hypothetical protein
MLCSVGSPGDPILTPLDHRDPVPPIARLEATVLHLESHGKLRRLIQFVDAWSQVAEPTVPAQLACIRAFIDFGMMDRAWVRLEHALEDERGGVEAHALAARMFLARGWHNRARGYVVKALESAPDDPELATLLQEASEPPTEADFQVESSDASVDALVTRARKAMCQGSFVRARALLERARRKAPEHPRVTDLLWVMQGDYTPDPPLAELVQQWGPSISPLPDLISLGSDEPEHTVSASKTEIQRALAGDHDPHANPAFHGLFRGLSGEPLPAGAPDETEVTAISTLKRLDSGAVPIGFADGGGDDTQIMLVIRKDDDADDDTDIQPAPTGPPPPPRTASDLGFEDEDDDLIVVTRRDDDNLEPDPNTDLGAVHLDPSADRPSEAAAELQDEGAAWAVRDPVPPTVPPARRRPARAPPTRPSTPQWLAIGVALLLSIAVLSGLLAIFFASQIIFGLM